MAAGLLQVLLFALTALIVLIIVQAIFSWLVAFNVINMNSGGMRKFVFALQRMTDPLYRPIRRILPDFGGIDFSPLVLLLLIQALRILLENILRDMPA